MECATCGQEFDPGDLSAVFFHEHQGIGDTPGLEEVGPGRQVSDGYLGGVEAEQEDYDDPSWGAAYGDHGP